MENKQVAFHVTALEGAIGTAVFFAMLLCHLTEAVGIQLQTLAVCTSAVMCVQNAKEASWKAGLTRVLGVICGGAAGVLVVLLDNQIGNAYIFMLLCGMAVVGNLWICKFMKLPLVQGRVSCMSLLLVVLVLQGTGRIQYAVGRLVGTIVGAVVALLVSMLVSMLSRLLLRKKLENAGR